MDRPDTGGRDGFHTCVVPLDDDGDGDSSLSSSVHVTLAADDGAAPASLFAFFVWNGGHLLASHLRRHPELMQDKATVEFGAAGALPSLAALSRGSRFSLLTDYLAQLLLDAMAATLADPRNASVLGLLDERATVQGHLWGTDPHPLLAAIPKIAEDEAAFFDVALVGECLWLHREHANLLASIYRCLHPGGQVSPLSIPFLYPSSLTYTHACACMYRRWSPSPITSPGAKHKTCIFSTWPGRRACIRRKGGMTRGGLSWRKWRRGLCRNAHVQGRLVSQFLYRTVKRVAGQQEG